MKKSILTLLALIMAAGLWAAGQQKRGKFSPEEFKARLESYLTQEAGFTQAEAGAFFPLYFEMKGKQRQLQHKIYQLKKNAPPAEAPDNDYSQAIQKIKDLGVEMAQLEVTYYKRMCQAVSPRKVYRAMCAEDRFHRNMLEEAGHDGKRPKENIPKQRN